MLQSYATPSSVAQSTHGQRPELCPLVLGTLAPVATPTLSVSINCLIDTGCLFDNFCKDTGIAFYTGINDFYQPLRGFYTPFTPFHAS